MNGQLAKEERRNLRRAIGETATAAVEQCRQMAFAVNGQQKVLASEVLALKADLADVKAKLHARVDGVSAWAQQNETAIGDVSADLTRDKGTILALLTTFDVKVTALQDATTRAHRFEQLTFLQRLRWLLFGPSVDVPDAGDAESDAIDRAVIQCRAGDL